MVGTRRLAVVVLLLSVLTFLVGCGDGGAQPAEDPNPHSNRVMLVEMFTQLG